MNKKINIILKEAKLNEYRNLMAKKEIFTVKHDCRRIKFCFNDIERTYNGIDYFYKLEIYTGFEYLNFTVNLLESNTLDDNTVCNIDWMSISELNKLNECALQKDTLCAQSNISRYVDEITNDIMEQGNKVALIFLSIHEYFKANNSKYEPILEKHSIECEKTGNILKWTTYYTININDKVYPILKSKELTLFNILNKEQQWLKRKK